MDDLVDEAIDETFPASDPPSYMAGAGILGAPSHSGIVREPAVTELRESDEHHPDTGERRIRERARRIWEAEGRPEGRADEHWRRAQDELAGEDANKPRQS
ncbi:MAG TPA: DUF2934 domain-containing protein [Beijerinckiaceae bacterium]|nr:DUF2934 domain-containing protein [Beijerinckiaceae bacterium]